MDRPVSFLPSEVARLVLGYLKVSQYNQTYKCFLKECEHLVEYAAMLKQGIEYPTTIMGVSLLELLEEYAELKLKDKDERILSVDIGAVWKQFDAITRTLKQKTKTQAIKTSCYQQRQRTKTRGRNMSSALSINQEGQRTDGAPQHKSPLRKGHAQSEKVICPTKDSAIDNNACISIVKVVPRKIGFTSKSVVAVDAFLTGKAKEKDLSISNSASDNTPTTSVEQSTKKKTRGTKGRVRKLLTRKKKHVKTFVSNTVINVPQNEDCDTEDEGGEDMDIGNDAASSLVNGEDRILSSAEGNTASDNLADASRDMMGISEDSSNRSDAVFDSCHNSEVDSDETLEEERRRNGACAGVEGRDCSRESERKQGAVEWLRENDPNHGLSGSSPGDSHALQIVHGSPEKTIGIQDQRTPVKALVQDSHTWDNSGKSPRRKRHQPKRLDVEVTTQPPPPSLPASSLLPPPPEPPKTIANNKDKPVPVQSDPFPMLLEKIMNDTKLHERLAETINKSRFTDHAQTTYQKPVATSIIVDDFFSPQAQVMLSEDTIDGIITQTKNDPLFDSLLTMFEAEAAKTAPISIPSQATSHVQTLTDNVPEDSMMELSQDGFTASTVQVSSSQAPPTVCKSSITGPAPSPCPSLTSPCPSVGSMTSSLGSPGQVPLQKKRRIKPIPCNPVTSALPVFSSPVMQPMSPTQTTDPCSPAPSIATQPSQPASQLPVPSPASSVSVQQGVSGLTTHQQNAASLVKHQSVSGPLSCNDSSVLPTTVISVPTLSDPTTYKQTATQDECTASQQAVQEPSTSNQVTSSVVSQVLPISKPQNNVVPRDVMSVTSSHHQTLQHTASVTDTPYSGTATSPSSVANHSVSAGPLCNETAFPALPLVAQNPLSVSNINEAPVLSTVAQQTVTVPAAHMQIAAVVAPHPIHNTNTILTIPHSSVGAQHSMTVLPMHDEVLDLSLSTGQSMRTTYTTAPSSQAKHHQPTVESSIVSQTPVVSAVSKTDTSNVNSSSSNPVLTSDQPVYTQPLIVSGQPILVASDTDSTICGVNINIQENGVIETYSNGRTSTCEQVLPLSSLPTVSVIPSEEKKRGKRTTRRKSKKSISKSSTKSVLTTENQTATDTVDSLSTVTALPGSTITPQPATSVADKVSMVSGPQSILAPLATGHLPPGVSDSLTSSNTQMSFDLLAENNLSQFALDPDDKQQEQEIETVYNPADEGFPRVMINNQLFELTLSPNGKNCVPRPTVETQVNKKPNVTVVPPLPPTRSKTPVKKSKTKKKVVISSPKHPSSSLCKLGDIVRQQLSPKTNTSRRPNILSKSPQSAVKKTSLPTDGYFISPNRSSVKDVSSECSGNNEYVAIPVGRLSEDGHKRLLTFEGSNLVCPQDHAQQGLSDKTSKSAHKVVQNKVKSKIKMGIRTPSQRRGSSVVNVDIAASDGTQACVMSLMPTDGNTEVRKAKGGGKNKAEKANKKPRTEKATKKTSKLSPTKNKTSRDNFMCVVPLHRQNLPNKLNSYLSVTPIKRVTPDETCNMDDCNLVLPSEQSSSPSVQVTELQQQTRFSKANAMSITIGSPQHANIPSSTTILQGISGNLAASSEDSNMSGSSSVLTVVSDPGPRRLVMKGKIRKLKLKPLSSIPEVSTPGNASTTGGKKRSASYLSLDQNCSGSVHKKMKIPNLSKVNVDDFLAKIHR